MERFTEHSSNIDKDSFRVKPNMSYYRSIDKLGKLEDLEEEIGCPLEVRCKIVYNTKIYRIGKKVGFIHKTYDNGFTAYCWKRNRLYEEYFDYIEYKKSWWLKADKSE